MIQRLAKKMYGKFNGKLFPIASIPMAWVAVLFLLVYKTKKQKFLLQGSALGDVVYTLSFLKAITDKYGESFELVLVSSSKYKSLIDSYSTKVDKVIYLPHLGIFHLFSMALAFTNKNLIALKLAHKNGIYPAIPGSCSWLFSPDAVGTRNKLAKVYDVPLLPVEFHSIPKVEISSIPEFEKNKARICIVNPYSYSMSLSMGLFEAIVNRLIEKGFIVYTNVIGNQQAIKGSEPLSCSVEELYSIASNIPLFVSVRSGILDFLIPSKVNMFVVYVSQDEEDSRIIQNFSLREWNSQGIIDEYVAENDSDKDCLVEHFEKFLDSLKKD